MFGANENSNSSESSSCQFNLLDILVDDGTKSNESSSFVCFNNINVDDGYKTDVDQKLVTYLTNVNENQENVTHKNNLCMSRNAITARESRKKKKEYITNLEDEVKRLKMENEELKSEGNVLRKCVQDYKTEVAYLKGVLANQSTLSKLLENVQSVPGVKFRTSFSTNKNGLAGQNMGKQFDEPSKTSFTYNTRRRRAEGHDVEHTEVCSESKKSKNIGSKSIDTCKPTARETAGDIAFKASKRKSVLQELHVCLQLN